jgi:hypothetical protein
MIEGLKPYKKGVFAALSRPDGPEMGRGGRPNDSFRQQLITLLNGNHMASEEKTWVNQLKVPPKGGVKGT